MKSKTNSKKWKNKTWNCSYCDKNFKYESEKSRHEMSHVPMFECTVCSKKFSFLSALRRHEKQHERTGNVHCNKCGGTFRDETLLKRHMQYAHKGTYKCKKCTATFNSDLALSSHLKIHMPDSEKKYRCTFPSCGKAFNFPHHLKHHEMTHTNAKQHFCKVCGKGFIQSHHLKIHQKRHEPDSWLPCVVDGCTKRFADEYARKRHLNTHKTASCDNLAPAVQNDSTILKSSTYGEEIIKDSVESLQTDEMPSIINTQFNIGSEELLKIEKSFTVTEIETCKTVIGECIVGESDDNKCLCKQMITTDECDDLKPKANTNIIKLTDEFNAEDINACGKECESCECASTCPAAKISNINTMPQIEYRIDGTVKLSETFDTDIETDVKTEKRNESVRDLIEIKDIKSLPFNSCRDVLGNCIVSGNSTMGEGCLCAKMSTDNQQIIAQEIEEITPCPKNMWFNQHL